MTDAEIMNMSDIEEVKATMRDKFPLMVQYFLEDSENYVATIRQGIAEAKVEKIVVPSHTLKSSARQMGALRLSNIAKNIEEEAREQVSAGKNNLSPFAEIICALEATFSETKEAYMPHTA